MHPQLKGFLEKWSAEVDRSLKRFLPPPKSALLKTIVGSMRYSLFAGGKRLRPALVVAGAEICGMNGKKALPTACALEMIHTYSLVHDDLPAMDDDDLRRGRPTNHKVYGEAIAILAGDGLLTSAFDLVSKNAKIVGARANFPEVVRVIAEGAGFPGMVGGQAVDVEMGEGHWTSQPRKKQIEILNLIHAAKTAALIRASVVAGALLAGARSSAVKRLSAYGSKIGLAFQIADDILDRVGDKKLLGKSGSDLENQKLTYPAIFGIEKSKEEAARLIREAKTAIQPFGKRSQILSLLADYIIERAY